MSAQNLEQMIQQADGDIVGMLRNAPMGNFAFPYKPEYSNWRDEQQAWATTAVLFDQSTHMTDVDFKGPDVKRLFSETAVNNFTNFGRNKAKQFVGVNEDGYIVGDGICSGSRTTSTRLWVRAYPATGSHTARKRAATTSRCRSILRR